MGDIDVKPSATVKYDWYQTETTIVITILAKNVVKEKSDVIFGEQSVAVRLALPNNSEHVRELSLAYPINPGRSNYVVSPSKVEVKLVKLEGIRWSQLEASANSDSPKVPFPDVATSSKPPSYPTSKPGKDWSEIERQINKEEAEDKLEGQDALNKLFQDIYGKGDDNVKRAMNKSYMESGGTVLSTNWKEISKERVEVKPPDGMEFKKWDS